LFLNSGAVIGQRFLRERARSGRSPIVSRMMVRGNGKNSSALPTVDRLAGAYRRRTSIDVDKAGRQ
jgi:hypothetical protein